MGAFLWVLTEAPVRAALRDAIRQTRLTHPFSINAWVLLPDHLHCIWTLPQDDADFSLRWSTIKRLVSKQCGQEYGIKDVSPSRTKRLESGLWQRRFWEHQIRDDHDFSRHVDYIHWNPAKHDLPLVRSIGLIRRSRVSSTMGFIRPIGGWAERI